MLEKFLQKSKSSRERYAFWGAVSITGVIGLVWFMALSINFQSNEPFTVDEGQQTASAFSQFFGEIKNDFFNIQAGEENEDAREGEERASTTEKEETQPSLEAPTPAATTTPRSIQIATSSLQNR
ncbi:MAG: hypothetical protein WDZ56_01250 [Candidatus Paceibacterota bacterium]